MKLDEKYKYGERPDTDFRGLLCFLGRLMGTKTLRCCHCAAPTQWVLVSSHQAVCSEECVVAMAKQATAAVSHHWLLDKDDVQGSLGGTLSGATTITEPAEPVPDL